MIQDSIQDSTRYVVGTEHKGSIMPGNRAEMWRNIYLEPGASIIGGIWGDELFVSGPGIQVTQSVYARGSINISGSNKATLDGDVEFGSVVVSPDSIMIENVNFKTRFLSDIYAGRINLTNAIVYGNIYATSAKFENCIILGGVYCKGKLQLKNTMVFTFKTKQLVLKEDVSLLSPFAISEESFEMKHPVRAFTFYNIVKNKDKKTRESGIIQLDSDDIFHVKYSDKKDEENKIPERVYVISIAERILNSSKIIEQFRQNKLLIEFLSFGSHLTEEYQQQFISFQKEDIEKALWEIIESEIEPEVLIGSSKFDDLVQLFQNVDISQ